MCPPAQINAVIANTGLSNETDVIIGFMVNGRVLENKTIPFIQNGTDTTISFNWTPTAVGWYNVSIYAKPVPDEDYVINNLATLYVQVPKAVLTDVYNDTGIDLDGDGLYDYLAIDVSVNVAEAGYYYLYGNLETLKEFYITDASNNTYLSVGKQNITLLFNGIDIRRIDLNGPYTLSNLRLRDNYWNTLDKRLKAYNTSFYDSKEFQLPKAMFTDVYNDTGVDTDNDTYYNYLSIDVGVNVSESGYYRWYGELYDDYGDSIAYEGNSSYLENGTQIIQINFDGFMIRKHKVDGPYYLKYLRLYDDNHIQQDSRHDAYVTSYYDYTEFQPPGAEFDDVYSDYGKDDEDEDELYNYLVINVGVNVRDAGDYRISGSLYENRTYNSIDSASNTTYLNEGNQTVQLRFDGITIRQNEYNETYDLKYLRLYNATYTDPVPPIAPPAPMPTPVPRLKKSEAKLTEDKDTNNFTVLYGEEFDYRRYAYTTKYYNWTDFQRPPAEFTPGFNDYGLDTNNNTLYDYLVIEKEIEVREAGNYELHGSLEAPSGKWIDSDWNYTYLDVGLHNATLKFYGPSIYLSGESGNFNVYMDLYDWDNGRWLDWATNTSSYYSYTDFERLPAEFTANFSDYGLDTDNDTLYNYLLVEAEINVTKAGEYELSGDLQYYDEEEGYWKGIDGDWNRTYLNVGIHNITLQFDGIRIYGTEYNGSFRTWLNLYETEEGKRIDEMEYFTNDYNYTDFQKPPAEFNKVYSDNGTDTDEDGLYNYLTIDVGVNVTKAGNYRVRGYLYDSTGYQIDYKSNTTYLSTGSQTVQLNFEGIKIRQNGVNGPYNLKSLRLYDSSTGVRLDYISDAYTTSYYNYTDFQIPPAEFNEVYLDTGTDTDGDGLYNYLTIDVGVNVTKAGSYRVRGYLYDNTGHQIDYESNTTYLNVGSQTVQLNFEGIKIRQNEVNGPYNLKSLYLYDSSTGDQLDYIHDAYTTAYYNYTDFQPPGAEFNDVYTDYGEDTDGDGLNNSLVINVGVNVTKAGTYRVRGELYENATYHYIISAYNTTYLDTGNHNVLLKFDGLRLRQNKYNGTYDLKYLYLYNYSYPVPPPTPTPTPVSASQLEKSEAIEVENVSVQYGEQLDYRYYAYTTGYYEWSGWQKPPAEFTGNFNDYGQDSDGDGLYDYLVIEAEINMTKGGEFEFWDDLYYYNETTGYWEYGVDCHKHNYSYLDVGVHNLTIKLEGIEIRKLEYNGTFKVRFYLDGKLNSKWIKIDEAEYYTKTYNWTNFQMPPAEFNDVYSDYGLNTTTEDNLYDYLVIEVGVNVTKAGRYKVRDDLYENTTGSYVTSAYNTSYLSEGNQTVQLRFEGITIRQNKYNGTYDIRLVAK